MAKQRLTDNLSSLNFLCLRCHLPWDRLPGVYLAKKLPFKITMKYAVEIFIRQAAESLICSITDKSSKLRLLTFEFRGFGPRRSFTRGWSHRADYQGSDCPHIILEHLVKYHIPEYEPMPESQRPETWKDRCENTRFVFEEWGKKNNKTS